MTGHEQVEPRELGRRVGAAKTITPDEAAQVDTVDVPRAREAGCFQDAKVELIGGRLVEMTETPPHMNCVLNVETAFNGTLSTSRFFVAREVSVRFPKWTPLPDVAVHRGPRRPTYEDRLPTAADTALIVEVSESTYLKDRTVKLARYARAAIPVYWIVHLAPARRGLQPARGQTLLEARRLRRVRAGSGGA